VTAVGESLTRIAALDAAFHMPTYARKPVLFVRGEGMRLYDDDGREYLDFVAGIGSVNLGHSHPAVVEAARDQIGRLTQVSNLFYVEHRSELASDLAGLLEAGSPQAGVPAKVFFCNSGAEANEGAIKLARRWGKAHRGDGCYRIVTAASSATMSLSGTWSNPSGSGANASCLLGWPVAASAPSVRPWNERSAVTIR
jgi:acetylornithine/N-succinyldiaminopimelate aminotransferase